MQSRPLTLDFSPIPSHRFDRQIRIEYSQDVWGSMVSLYSVPGDVASPSKFKRRRGGRTHRRSCRKERALAECIPVSQAVLVRCHLLGGPPLYERLLHHHVL